MNKTYPKEMTERERIAYERGFEDGYEVAKRNYKPIGKQLTEADMTFSPTPKI